MNHEDAAVSKGMEELAGQFSKTRVNLTKNDVKSFINSNGLRLDAVKLWENFKGDSTAIDTFLKKKKAEQVESRKPKPIDRSIFASVFSKSSGVNKQLIGIRKGGYHKSRRSSHKRVLRHSKKQKRVRHTRRKQTRRHRR